MYGNCNNFESVIKLIPPLLTLIYGGRIVRQNLNVIGSTNYSRRDIQSITEDCNSWRLWAEGLNC